MITVYGMGTYDEKSATPPHVPGNDGVHLVPDRIERLLRLLSVIQSHGSVDGHNLPNLAGVSRRTVFRDLQLLRDAGVPVEYSRSLRTFTIADDYFLGPLNLDSAETEALALAFVLLEGQLSHPWAEPLRRAEAKIAAAIKNDHQLSWNAILRNVEVAQPPTSPADSIGDVFTRIHEAINAGLELRVQIDQADQPPELIILRPLRLAFIHIRWHVLAQLPYHQDALRLFPLDRFVHLSATGQHFDPPRPVSLPAHLGNAWRVDRGKPDYLVEILFDASIADDVELIRWHVTQETVWQPDGTLKYRAIVAGLKEITRWVLGYGPLAEVLGPPELREAVRRAAQQTIARYAHAPHQKAAAAVNPLRQT